MTVRSSGRMTVLVVVALLVFIIVNRNLQLNTGVVSFIMMQQQESMGSLAAAGSGAISNGCGRNGTGPADYYTDKDNFRLAYEQSFGYFDDITNKDWKRRQEAHALAFPNHFGSTFTRFTHDHFPSHPGKYTNQQIYDLKGKARNWFAENFQPEFSCPLTQRLPSNSPGDGPKWVCDPFRLRKKKDCLVYSVGSNGNVMFEKAVKDEIGDHCEIHTFDLVAQNKRNGDFAEALEGFATFHHWGLAPEGKNPNPLFKSLQQTMKELGHEGRSIDLFKIDCEWCEWITFSDWLTVDMRQILVEMHNAPMPHARDFFYELHDAGFVIFSKEANYQSGAGAAEYAFLKLHPDFFVNNTRYSTNPKTKDYYAKIEGARFPFDGSTKEVGA